jgi:Protein of unknown function (DUF1405).
MPEPPRWVRRARGLVDTPAQVGLLLVIDAVAIAVGISFYAHSTPGLADVAVWWYPLFADSPVAVGLGALTVAWWLGRRGADAPPSWPAALLSTLAVVWLVRMGLWTVGALTLGWRAYLGADAVLWSFWGILATHVLFLAHAAVTASVSARRRGTLASPRARSSSTTWRTTASGSRRRCRTRRRPRSSP